MIFIIIFQANAATSLIACAILCLGDTDCVGFQFISVGSYTEMYVIHA